MDNLIEHFRDKERRKEFFKEYKEIEMLYEIISPDAFLRPFIDDYTTLSAIYAVVRNAYAKKVYVDRAFQKKTNELVQKHIGADQLASVTGIRGDRRRTRSSRSRTQKGGDGTKVINLIKSIEKTAEENSDDPFLSRWPSAPRRCRRASRTGRPAPPRRWTSCSRRSSGTSSERRSRPQRAWTG